MVNDLVVINLRAYVKQNYYLVSTNTTNAASKRLSTEGDIKKVPVRAVLNVERIHDETSHAA